MASITEAVAERGDSLLFVCDFSPPRGKDDAVFDRICAVEADFISVAYNPGKAARLNSAFAARWLEEHAEKRVAFTLATRDMNKLAAQSLLLGADLLGLENVVVLQGDPFSERELESVATVDDFTPTQLLRSVQALNEGIDYRGSKLRSPTNLCAGAAIDLGHGLERELQLTRRKVEAGAQFFLMQPLFDIEPLTEFLDRYAERYGEALSTPLFCGVQIPGGTDAPTTPRAELLSDQRRESKLPHTNRLVGGDVATLQQQLGDVAEAQLVAQAPEHGEQYDVGRILQPVEECAGALVEAIPAGSALEAPVASAVRCFRRCTVLARQCGQVTVAPRLNWTRLPCSADPHF